MIINPKTSKKVGTTRRAFIKTAALTTTAFQLTGCNKMKTTAQSSSPDRPNILFIMTDQQCADMMSCAGNPNLHTPAMDRIAAGGVVFNKAYCPQPLCVPARVSLFTGKMPHETQVTYNVEEMETSGPFMGRLLADAGYDCGYVGKWHVTLDPNDSERHGFASCHTINPASQSAYFGFHRRTAENFGRTDDAIPESCAEFIERKRNAPFFLAASFNNPHDICQWARGDALPNGTIPSLPEPDNCPQLPNNFEIGEHEPEIIREQQKKSPKMYPTIGWPDEKWRQYRWAYARMTEIVDSYIGSILDSLQKSGQGENTVIIFTSDHGDGNAAHRWNQKMTLYEEPARIPFIISGNGVRQPGRVDNEHLISNGLDLIPTLCDYAKIETPDGLAGKSIRPLVENRRVDPWREFVVCETDLHHRYGQPDGAWGRMLRTKRYKYIVYAWGDMREQLFDMERDPGEMNNLAVNSESKSILEDHRQKLRQWCLETRDPFLTYCIE